jgi:hypothetical protein
MEAAVRTAHFFVTGKELPKPEVMALRPANTLPGVKELRGVQVGPYSLNLAVVTGIS